VTKDTDRRAVAMVALSPLPPRLPRRFTLIATFHLPTKIGPWPAGVQWASTLGMRNRDEVDGPEFKLAGATQQFRGDADPRLVKVGLGLGSGAMSIPSESGIDLVDVIDAYPAPT
jgi:hypothetical protein